ncbi:MAG: hypothetical protein F6K22_24135 [Okeania sp. SIO2F4]|uniref:hypothetical protein n=1 Tax=Okeania sp. SIO2F4 TaxID=2607790 RepID=UPI00142A5CDD|nr:hypothetical protein [Okeania sp. SIO2F4]NES05625.1 hypothetical protein [Okeania sp. SIO2F4]
MARSRRILALHICAWELVGVGGVGSVGSVGSVGGIIVLEKEEVQRFIPRFQQHQNF